MPRAPRPSRHGAHPLALAPNPSPITADPSPGALRAALHGAYDLLWLVAILVGAPYFLLRGLRDRVFRRMAKERLVLRPLLQARTRRRVLIHGVSVGEVKGAAPLVRGQRCTVVRVDKLMVFIEPEGVPQ